jgi:hypothetical protein
MKIMKAMGNAKTRKAISYAKVRKVMNLIKIRKTACKDEKNNEICRDQKLRSHEVQMLGRLHEGGYVKTMKAKMLHEDQKVCES